VPTGVIGRMMAVGEGAREVYHALLTYTSLVKRSSANVHVVAMSVAILLWSAAILRSRLMGRAVGIAGVVAGTGILLGLFSGHLRMDVHGFGLVTLAHAAWLIWLGILLCRGRGGVSEGRAPAGQKVTRTPRPAASPPPGAG